MDRHGSVTFSIAPAKGWPMNTVLLRATDVPLLLHNHGGPRAIAMLIPSLRVVRGKDVHCQKPVHAAAAASHPPSHSNDARIRE
jgi:hypothetical protein